MIEKDSLQFLEDLKQNNNREWFLANKRRYEKYKENYHNIIRRFLDEMIKIDPSLKNLDIKDCSFRINRDIRFSKDKSPYKTHMGIWMSGGQKNTNLAGYYVHIANGESFCAGGVYHPEPADLKKIRKEIAFFHEDLEKIVGGKKFRDTFGDLDRNEENMLKSTPKDYEKDHPAIDFLRLKWFTASTKITDKELLDKNFVAKTAGKLSALKPLNDFLNRALTE